MIFIINADYPFIALIHVPMAGQHVAAFIDFLIDNGTPIENFHLMVTTIRIAAIRLNNWFDYWYLVPAGSQFRQPRRRQCRRRCSVGPTGANHRPRSRLAILYAEQYGEPVGRHRRALCRHHTHGRRPVDRRRTGLPPTHRTCRFLSERGSNATGLFAVAHAGTTHVG